MIRSIKDFFVEYQVEHEKDPQEEEWMQYYDQLIDEVELRKDDECGE